MTNTIALPLASPVSWDLIDRIDVRRPRGTRGAVAAGVIGIASDTASFRMACHSDPELGPCILGVLALPSLGVVIGAAIGAVMRRCEVVGRRKGDGVSARPLALR